MASRQKEIRRTRGGMPVNLYDSISLWICTVAVGSAFAFDYMPTGYKWIAGAVGGMAGVGAVFMYFGYGGGSRPRPNLQGESRCG